MTVAAAERLTLAEAVAVGVSEGNTMPSDTVGAALPLPLALADAEALPVAEGEPDCVGYT